MTDVTSEVPLGGNQSWILGENTRKILPNSIQQFQPCVIANELAARSSQQTSVEETVVAGSPLHEVTIRQRERRNHNSPLSNPSLKHQIGRIGQRDSVRVLV